MKKNSDRYSVSSDEDYEPNSNNEVLKNFLEIKSKERMEEIEEQELERAEDEIFDEEFYGNDHVFTVEDICNIHELWLGDIYPFAGKFRTVNMNKDGYQFAAANQIEKLMNKFEINFLSKYTPCNFSNDLELAHALGILHVEFILIHPFREGNGRIARLLADLMAAQSNRPLLNYESIDRTIDRIGYEKYILAIHAGHAENYGPIEKIFLEILKKS